MEFKGTKGKWIQNGINGVHNNNGNCVAISEGKTKEEMKANALLISKAPEMLEMLLKISKFLKWQSEIDKTDSCEKAYKEIHNLIKQATEL